MIDLLEKMYVCLLAIGIVICTLFMAYFLVKLLKLATAC